MQLGLDEPLGHQPVAQLLGSGSAGGAGMDDEDLADVGQDPASARVVFSIINAAPSRARLIPLPAGGVIEFTLVAIVLVALCKFICAVACS